MQWLCQFPGTAVTKTDCDVTEGHADVSNEESLGAKRVSFPIAALKGEEKRHWNGVRGEQGNSFGKYWTIN